MARVNELRSLMQSGRLNEGTVLYHAARRYPDRRAEATLEKGGGLRVRGIVYPSASTAARAVAGHSVNGWVFWKVKESGATLDQLRREARG